MSSPNTLALMESVREALDEAESEYPEASYGPPPVVEAASDILLKNMKGGGKGRDLEKKAKEKRGKIKKLGAGRNPFRHKSSNGPARAMPPVKRPRNVKKTGDWKCSCGSYKCSCRRRDGYKKTVRIKRSYKKAYNHAFKRWRRAQVS